MNRRTKITVGEREFDVQLRLKEIREFKELTGCDLMKGEADFGDTDTVIAFFFVLLKTADPDLGEDEVMEMIHLKDIPRLTREAFGLIGESMPKPEEAVTESRPLAVERPETTSIG